MLEKVMGLNVINDDEYQKYREGMLPILKSYGGSFGYDFKIAEVLQSKTKDRINRVFTIEFPSKQKMDAFFSDPDYLKVQRLHFQDSVQSKTEIAVYEKEPDAKKT
jgi:uncharacterized protein (DUF1330 family)